MKCCASRITCNVDSAALARVRTTLDALLFEQILKPIAPGAETLGEYEIGEFARTLAERLNDRER